MLRRKKKGMQMPTIQRYYESLESMKTLSQPHEIHPLFWKEVFHNPLRVGAIGPSSHNLGETMVRETGAANARTIIELGPGSGAITHCITEQMRPDAQLLGIENNSTFIDPLQQRFPQGQFVQGCASQVRQIAGQKSFLYADCILSTLPWSIFTPILRDAIIGSIQLTLARHGVFATAVCYGTQYLPAGRDLEHSLRAVFRKVETSPMVLLNMPPMRIYYCSH